MNESLIVQVRQQESSNVQGKDTNLLFQPFKQHGLKHIVHHDYNPGLPVYNGKRQLQWKAQRGDAGDPVHLPSKRGD